MVFKRLLGAFGIGGPSVDTVLAVSHVSPGGSLSGEVRIKGGDSDAEIEYVGLALVTRVETEHEEGEHSGLGEFFRTEVSGPFVLRAGEERAIPFVIPVPWETPLTQVEGVPLHGMAMGVRTELSVARAVDKGDLDPFSVAALPSQEAVLTAFSRLGFHFRGADLETGHLYGVSQQLPFYQEIEFHPPAQYAGRVNEIELTFVASPSGLEVILEADKRGGHGSDDAFGRFQVTHEQALRIDWAGEITGWLNGLAGHHGGQHGHYEEHGHHGGHYDGHHEEHGHYGGGAIAAAGIAGLAGGFLAAEAIDEIGDFFEGDEEEDE
ncbi:sporulation protein [Streptosporangium sp. NPDC051023]|uniref:sporulation protein n=1 Tax=Streptosporangium sp. NPDC051023 TaxID=3155410 RepID=UPI00344CF3BD